MQKFCVGDPTPPIFHWKWGLRWLPNGNEIYTKKMKCTWPTQKNMLVFFALANTKVLSFALGNAKLPDASSFASQWNISFTCYNHGETPATFLKECHGSMFLFLFILFIYGHHGFNLSKCVSLIIYSLIGSTQTLTQERSYKIINYIILHRAPYTHTELS